MSKPFLPSLAHAPAAAEAHHCHARAQHNAAPPLHLPACLHPAATHPERVRDAASAVRGRPRERHGRAQRVQQRLVCAPVRVRCVVQHLAGGRGTGGQRESVNGT